MSIKFSAVQTQVVIVPDFPLPAFMSGPKVEFSGFPCGRQLYELPVRGEAGFKKLKVCDNYL
jgi:hypothetical protein